MALPGFDERWKSLPDFVLGVTREIWEGRRVDTLRRSYAPQIVVRSPASVVVGNEAVIAATMATLAEFPDRELLGEDVIWYEEAPGSYLSSHRLVSTATHARAGAYGPPTGRKLRYRIIADCHCAADCIDDEWLVRDQGAIVRQLGIDPRDYARELIAAEGGPEACVRPFTPERDKPGPYKGHGNADEWGARLAELLERLMAGDFAAISTGYDRGASLHYAGGVDTHGHAGAESFWLPLRAAFPDAAFTIHHRIGRAADPLLPPRAAVRWSLHGRHAGWGAFGRPTGAEVHVMGMTHAEFGPEGLRREFTLIDETAIWKQILLHTGDT